jgi:hypothetical protein
VRRGRLWGHLLVMMIASLTLAWSTAARAAVRRYALVVGDDRGDSGDVTLRYAETDAQRVYDVLKDLGGFEPADMILLAGEGGPRIQASLIALNDRIRANVAAGQEVFLLVYYSGHAGADALHAAGTHLDVLQLEQLVRGSAATFRALVLDACRSGALTRVKGGHPAPPFDLRVDDRLSEQGLVLLTSSSESEDAQESDALKGSFFTHHLVSALLGAGDADGDGMVTLDEAYRYAYDATLRSSSETLAGLQHPTFRYDLRGEGRLALTRVVSAGETRATLAFPPGRTYLVMRDGEQGAVVGEVGDTAVGRRLSLRAGRYFVRGRGSDVLFEGAIDAPAGATIDVADDRLQRIAYARLVRKGGGEARVRHGPEAGYAFETAHANASGLCQGVFAGYAFHLQNLSVSGRLGFCEAGAQNDVLRSHLKATTGEIRAAHAFDLPWVTIDLGVAIGGGVFDQTFETTGKAPARVTPLGSLALLTALRVDLVAGFSLVAESAAVIDFYAQGDGASAARFAPSVAFRQSVGVAKVW